MMVSLACKATGFQCHRRLRVLSLNPTTTAGRTKTATGKQNARKNKKRNIAPTWSLLYPLALAKLKLAIPHIATVPKYKNTANAIQPSAAPLTLCHPLWNMKASNVVIAVAQINWRMLRLRCLVIMLTLAPTIDFCKGAGFHGFMKADLRRAIKLLMVAVSVFPNPGGVDQRAGPPSAPRGRGSGVRRLRERVLGLLLCRVGICEPDAVICDVTAIFSESKVSNHRAHPVCPQQLVS